MPNINAEILTWARESAGLSVETAAAKLQLKDSIGATAAQKLLAYENGKAPSRSLLKRMSKQYRKPMLTFYLAKPPVKEDRGEDFRTLPNGIAPEEDALVDALIRDIKARQSILRETLIEEDEAEKIPFIGSIGIDSQIIDTANRISNNLNFQLDYFRKCSNSDEAFKYLRESAERLGVFVLLMGNLGSHHTNFDPKVFRGFVLSDDYAPIIVINDQDAKSAWCFTLLHEIVHLWLGQTGVSCAFSENAVEKFCNDVASEILLTASELADFKPDRSDFSALSEEIFKYANAANISSAMVSYRLLRIGYISETTWQQLSSYFRDRWLEIKKQRKESNRKQDGGPSYYVVRRNKLGNALVSFAERMTYSGAISTTKASLLLGVKPVRVHKLFDNGQVA